MATSSPMADSHLAKAAQIRSKYLSGRPQLLERQQVGTSNTDVSVMQWNLLAYGLSAVTHEVSGANQGDFCCERGALDWPKRRAMILEEMLLRRPHLIACQEIDDFAFFDEHLSSVGYSGLFQPKPNSPCLTKKLNIGPDGCAVFWLKERFAMAGSGHKVLEREPGRRTNSVALWATLRDRADETKPPLTFAATHFKAKDAPEERKIRLGQARDLRRALEREAGGSSAAVLCCGDFNGEPDEPFYKVFADKNGGLDSAYRAALDGKEPSWTTWKRREGSEAEKRRCIDYIWYSKQHFKPKDVLALPKEEDVPPRRLPSLNFPSDHLNLWANFERL